MIECQLLNTIQSVTQETQRLENLSMKLSELDSGLSKIHIWSVESAPVDIQRIQKDQSNPELMAHDIGKVQNELQKKRDSLDRLTADLQTFENGK